MASPKYLVDEVRGKSYVRAWKEGKGREREFCVQVWLNKDKPKGEPDGDWGMPFEFGLEGSIDQSLLQTK